MTYERRASKDGKWEGSIARRFVTLIDRRRYTVRLTQHLKRGEIVKVTHAATLLDARAIVRDWIAE